MAIAGRSNGTWAATSWRRQSSTGPDQRVSSWKPGTTRRRREDAESAQRAYLWNSPDGTKPNFAQKYMFGDDIVISWNALNNAIYDLWLTSWDLDTNPVTFCLMRAVNLSYDGGLHLETSVTPTNELARETRYVLRFKPPNPQGNFVASDPDLSSPGFLLVQRGAENDPGGQVAAQSTASAAVETAAPTTTLLSGVFTTTVFLTSPSRSISTTAAEADGGQSKGGEDGTAAGLSPAATTGLIVGLILGLGLLLVMGVFYLSWRRKRRGAQGNDGKAESAEECSGCRDTFVEVGKAKAVMITEASWMSPELPGDMTWGQQRVHELPGSRIPRSGSPGRAMTINSSLVELDGEGIEARTTERRPGG
ncbi:hypothetical protein VTJ04DRAFT_2049 [Mycothermus thermophilus]|uniref:uncharacterized protein n=1 Tax=Humicola insolens TaxID=85995 RepID=UPI003741EACD